MKFVKGMIIGSLVSTSIVMICKETMPDTRKMIKKGKQFVRKMGMM